MNIESWKQTLIKEIETAAEHRAELVMADRDDPRIAKSQAALFDLAQQLRALPADDAALIALYREENELGALLRSIVGEPESRYRHAKEGLLADYGITHQTFASVGEFLQVLRDRVDETISEYRLRV